MKTVDKKKCVLKGFFVGVASVVLLGGCSSSIPVGEPLARVQEWNKHPVYNKHTEKQMLDWLKQKTPRETVYTPEDRWPNEFAVCMTPLLINWKSSKWKDQTNGFVLVRNVQIGGNPIRGRAIYGTVRIPVRAVERVELVVVRYHLKGPARRDGHVQLRFVFNKDHRPEILNANGKQDSTQPFADDLIISWESWRPSNTKWEFVKGLNPKEYALTARIYLGCQRFLNDSLRGAVWDCYPLKLSDKKTADLLLWDALVMGDLVARKSLKQITNNSFKSAQSKIHPEQVPDGFIKDLLKNADISYQALNRSCISMALAQIELTMRRIDQGNTGTKRTAISYSPGKPPVWFERIALGEKRSIGQAFHALFWAGEHEQIFPYKAYLPLKEAGLLQTDKKGKIIKYRYGHKIGSPYGKLMRNLM